MDKTPVQKFMNDLLNKVEIHSGCKVVRLSDIQNIFDKTTPTERQFAETCFDAGKSYGSDTTTNIYTYRPLSKPDFTNFFKKYSND